jgi:hypothetical protein
MAAPLLLDPATPVKGKKAFGKVRWDFNGAWEAVISQGPPKGTKVSCIVNTMIAGGAVGSRIERAQVPGRL